MSFHLRNQKKSKSNPKQADKRNKNQTEINEIEKQINKTKSCFLKKKNQQNLQITS